MSSNDGWSSDIGPLGFEDTPTFSPAGMDPAVDPNEQSFISNEEVSFCSTSDLGHVNIKIKDANFLREAIKPLEICKDVSFKTFCINVFSRLIISYRSLGNLL